jgi:hypothetical protein
MSGDQRGPLVSFAVGGLSVALWENTVENGGGAQRTTESVSLRRTFFNKKANRLEDQSITINPSEIGCLSHLLARMEEAVIKERRRQEEPF